MWQCPQCGRTFQKKNQNHTCSERPLSVDAYIAGQPEAAQPLLRKVRETLRAALPGASECISWSMPTYWDQHNIVHFATAKQHIGLYPGDQAVEHFRERLAAFKTSKGAIQLPYSQPLPLDLIAEIARWCAATGHHHGSRG
jgi:uncharacterized protein YdhG (YjbR/CyaY superfamily)